MAGYRPPLFVKHARNWTGTGKHVKNATTISIIVVILNSKAIKMLLDEYEKLYVNSIWASQVGGHRKLDDHEFRMSAVVKPACAQLFDKIRPEQAPELDKPAYSRDGNGVISVQGSKAAAGTFLHEGFQKTIDPDLVENTARLTIDTDGAAIEVTGHIDVELPAEKTLSDIKTVSMFVFPGITGQRPMKPNSYTWGKREHSIEQANYYATARNYPAFNITWVNRDTGEFRVEQFDTDKRMAEKTTNRIVKVFRALRTYRATGNLPVLTCEAFQMCDLDRGKTYCRHHVSKGGPCPGRMSYPKTEFWEGINPPAARPSIEDVLDDHTTRAAGGDGWTCRHCGKPVHEVTRPAEGHFMPHHLWYDHDIRDFDPASVNFGRVLE